MFLLEDTQQWILHDHQKIKTVKGKRNRRQTNQRMTSIMSAGSENLGFIPEYNTLPVKPSKKVSNNEPDHSTLPHKPRSNNPQHTAELPNNDNLSQSISTSSTKELVLDLSDLEVSMSTGELSSQRQSSTRSFYEAFSTPRSQTYLDRAEDNRLVSLSAKEKQDNVNNNYSYPNISLQGDSPRSPSNVLSSMGCKNTAPASDQDYNNALEYADSPLTLSQLSDSPAVPKRVSQAKFGNSRVTYLTQMKLGETVRLQQESKKKRKRVNPKGTIHYGFRSDVSLAKL